MDRDLTPREDEKLVNGVLICKKCGGNRSFELEPGLTIRCNCKCMDEAFEKKLEEEKKQRELERYQALQNASLLGARYKNVTFENTNLNRDASFVKAYNRCKKYCENSKAVADNGYGIYIYGNGGTGKTHLLACIVNELIKQKIPCLITNMFEIMNAVRTNQTFLAKIEVIPFLLIDDIGTERVKTKGEDNWVQDKLYEIINKRYNNLMPTIFSSNCDFKDLSNRGLMEKTIQRIFSLSSLQLEIKGESYRLK